MCVLLDVNFNFYRSACSHKYTCAHLYKDILEVFQPDYARLSSKRRLGLHLELFL